jgi:hypothetical protein
VIHDACDPTARVSPEFAKRGPDPDLLSKTESMIWLIPLTILFVGAGALMRVRRRGSRPRSLKSQPVSGEWLAQARSRDDHHW